MACDKVYFVLEVLAPLYRLARARNWGRSTVIQLRESNTV